MVNDLLTIDEANEWVKIIDFEGIDEETLRDFGKEHIMLIRMRAKGTLRTVDEWKESVNYEAGLVAARIMNDFDEGSFADKRFAAIDAAVGISDEEAFDFNQ